MDRTIHRQLIGSVLARAITPEQINAGREGASRGLHRQAEVRNIDEQARTVEIAFSSEAPVERWFGDEILSHDAAAVRLDRLRDGGPLLVDHDWRDHVGTIVSVSIDGDRRGRAVVRLGRSARAEEVWQDVVDGIRRHVSVGYMVHGIEVEMREGEPDKVTVNDWEPFEVSFVAIPADTSVGVGRSHGAGISPEGENAPAGENGADGSAGADGSQTRSEQMIERILRDASGNLVRAKVDEDGVIVEVLEVLERAGEDVLAARRAASGEERDRVRAISEMGERYDASDLAIRAIGEGLTADAFRAQLLDHVDSRANGQRDGEPSRGPLSADQGIGMSEREVQRFSFVRAIRALANPTDRSAQEAARFEFEVSEAAAQAAGRDAQGVMVPADVLTRAINTSTSGATAGDTGGFSVATDLLAQSFIEMLRNRSTLMRLGTPLGGLVGNADVPSQVAGAQGYWIGEDEEAPETGLELGQKELRPRTVAGYSEITRRMLMQSSLDFEALVRRDLATALALTADRAGFYGAGGAEPLGIAGTPGVNVVDFGGAGSGGGSALPTFAEVVQMETEIATDNADVQSMAYVLGAGLRGHFKSAEKFPGSSGRTIWEDGNQVNGYGAEVTNQVDAGDMFFGNFSDLVIGMWGGLDITVDPYSNSKRGRLRIVMMQDMDILIRHAESFCFGTDAS